MEQRQNENIRGLSTPLTILAVIATLMIILGVFYFFSRGRTSEEVLEIPETTNPIQTENDIGAIEDDIRRYVGETVTIAGEVEETFGETAFILEEDELFDSEVVVITPDGVARFLDDTDKTTLINEDKVKVMGEVRLFEESALEEEFNIDLDPNITTSFDGQIAIISDVLELNPTE